MNKRSTAILGIFVIILCLGLDSGLYATVMLFGSDADTQELFIIDTTDASTTKVGSFGVEGINM